ncbi:MAG: hypothetical protein JNK05_24685 [Myxococcales bacterium]|nr:hypothetical protein [Myxococcales bacterium]
MLRLLTNAGGTRCVHEVVGYISCAIARTMNRVGRAIESLVLTMNKAPYDDSSVDELCSVWRDDRALMSDRHEALWAYCVRRVDRGEPVDAAEVDDVLSAGLDNVANGLSLLLERNVLSPDAITRIRAWVDHDTSAPSRFVATHLRARLALEQLRAEPRSDRLEDLAQKGTFWAAMEAAAFLPIASLDALVQQCAAAPFSKGQRELIVQRVNKRRARGGKR